MKLPEKASFGHKRDQVLSRTLNWRSTVNRRRWLIVAIFFCATGIALLSNFQFGIVYSNIPMANITFHKKLRLFAMCTACDQPRILTTRTTPGRFGNKLYLIASLYGTARRYGFIPVLRSDEPVLEVLDRESLQIGVVTPEDWHRVNWHSWMEPGPRDYDERSLSAALQKSNKVHIQLYLQSYLYFKGFEGEIVPQIRFGKAVHDWADQYFRGVLQQASNSSIKPVVVGMHVRRGDYLSSESQQQGFFTAPLEFFIKAMNYFVSVYKRVLFLVSSDSIDWCEESFRALSRSAMFRDATFHYIRGNETQPERDLALLSLAEHSIISVGTFSFWSAMLRQYRTGRSDNGTTIYYGETFGAFAAEYRKHIATFYPSQWIGFE